MVELRYGVVIRGGLYARCVGASGRKRYIYMDF